MLLITGCATPYKSIEDTDGRGGYYHQRLSEDTFRVVFEGNGFTEYKRAYDFALLRVAEICVQLGYTHFVLEGQDDTTTVTDVDMGSTSYTSGSLYGYGDSASFFGTTQTYHNSMPVMKPGVVLVARYFVGKPTGKYLEIFTAGAIINMLSYKYSLDIKTNYSSNRNIASKSFSSTKLSKESEDFNTENESVDLESGVVTESDSVEQSREEYRANTQNRKIKGYQATTDPKTGKMITYPVYEDEK